MPEYLSPGVYIEEIEIGAKPIEGVSTSTAGFLGETERGPTIPRLVTSWTQYQRLFGGYFGDTKYLPYAMQGFFDNGGQRCYLARIVKADATSASLKLKDASGGDALTVRTIGEGSWGERVVIKASAGTFGGFKLNVYYWKTLPSPLYDPELDAKTQPRPAASEVFDNLSLDEASPDYYGKQLGASSLVTLFEAAGDSGALPAVGHHGTARAGSAATITLAAGASATDDAYNGMQIEITGGTGSGQTRTVVDYDGATRVATVDSNWATTPDATSGYLISVHGGTAQAGSAATITLAVGASATDDAYNGMQVEITGGTGSGQTRTVVGYDGATRVATVDSNWATAPDDTSVYRVSIQGGTAQAGGADTITLAASASATDDAYNGMQIEITGGTGSGQTRTIVDYDGATQVATVDSNWATAPDDTSVYRVNSIGTAQGGVAGTITLAASASATDDAYNGMQVEITGGTGSGQTRTIVDYDGATQVATVSAGWDTTPDNTSVYRLSLTLTALAGGSDGSGALALADYQRTDTATPGNRKGLTAFSEIDDISILYSPNAYAIAGLVGALVTHCESLKDRFVVLDAQRGSVDVSTLDPRSNDETQYGAFYYPWIKVVDPAAGVRRLIPPGGHVAGIYARTDTERGVHKAPANEGIRGAVDVEFKITKGEHDVLNPRGVNVIRSFPGRGILVWGARTLSTNTLWKYVNVRRLFIFLEESIDEGTQWVVFEPNSPALWARVRATITEFLTRVWRDGALFGNTPDEAFFVKADESTMTPDDIVNGRLIVLIGIAPVRPAEFVIFRIAQLTRGPE